MEQLAWEYVPHEQGVTMNDIGEPHEFNTNKEYQQNKRSIKRKIRYACKIKYGEESEKYYFSKQGAVWIGGLKELETC